MACTNAQSKILAPCHSPRRSAPSFRKLLYFGWSCQPACLPACPGGEELRDIVFKYGWTVRKTVLALGTLSGSHLRAGGDEPYFGGLDGGSGQLSGTIVDGSTEVAQKSGSFSVNGDIE